MTRSCWICEFSPRTVTALASYHYHPPKPSLINTNSIITVHMAVERSSWLVMLNNRCWDISEEYYYKCMTVNVTDINCICIALWQNEHPPEFTCVSGSEGHEVTHVESIGITGILRVQYQSIGITGILRYYVYLCMDTVFLYFIYSWQTKQNRTLDEDDIPSVEYSRISP